MHSQSFLLSNIIEHLFVNEQLIEEVVIFADDSEFCIHSKLINESQEINSRLDSEYYQEFHSNLDMDVDQDTKQIVSSSKQKVKTCLNLWSVQLSSKYQNPFQMYN